MAGCSCNPDRNEKSQSTINNVSLELNALSSNVYVNVFVIRRYAVQLRKIPRICPFNKSTTIFHGLYSCLINHKYDVKIFAGKSFHCKVLNILTSFLWPMIEQIMESCCRFVFLQWLWHFCRPFPLKFLGKSRERDKKQLMRHYHVISIVCTLVTWDPPQFYQFSQPSPQAFSARLILDSTVSCDVTERYTPKTPSQYCQIKYGGPVDRLLQLQPALSQTSRGQRGKRERLGTRLQFSYILSYALPLKLGLIQSLTSLRGLRPDFGGNADWLLEQYRGIWLAVEINGSWKSLFLEWIIALNNLREWSAVSGEKDCAGFFVCLFVLFVCWLVFFSNCFTVLW